MTGRVNIPMLTILFNLRQPLTEGPSRIVLGRDDKYGGLGEPSICDAQQDNRTTHDAAHKLKTNMSAHSGKKLLPIGFV